MASSYSHFAPACSSSLSCNCEVFLSFRGEDTRKTFVDHLYSALVDRKISTFKDDETLRQGETIRPSLLKAIEGAQIAVIIFSEKYADSSWCLEELAHIMKCKEERSELTVIPVFHGVVPSEVRKQEGDFGKGFSKQEGGNIDKVETWRKALVGACEITGWETGNIANGHESKGIKEIADTISNKLFSITSSVTEGFVGLKARMEELEAKLKIGSDGVKMVGIWGCGGSGKSTLASSIHKKISGQFQGHCIVDNIREKSDKYGLETLQENILSKLLNTKEVKVHNVEEGKDMISRLRHSNVLILLDDVDNAKQLEALAGSHDWFGSGSRIIITTRDEHLLRIHNADYVCPVRLLSHEEAVTLFNKRAYNEKKHIQGYETLSSSVVKYADGLPLALKVLGSFLNDKEEKEWRSTLIRLEAHDTPQAQTEILEQLKISYDGLKSVEQELFLDIACFFRRESIDEGREIFEACGYHPGVSIQVLTQKALITIVDGKFDMHDLIQEMAHNIVRGKHPNNPKKHSRVWKKEEIVNMCHGDGTMETYKTEAIQYYGDLSPLYKIVSNMKRLRWLSLTSPYTDDLPDVFRRLFQKVEAPSFLSNELCYINLECYPKNPFPESFQPMKLVTLKLTYSLQKQLWKGCKCLPYLKVLKLYKMKNLRSTPDFDGLPSLQTLTLDHCKRLTLIHTSLGNLTFIEDVCIRKCSRIRMFPAIVQMRRLKTLEILECSHELNFPKIKSSMQSLLKLSLSHMGIDSLLSSLGEDRFSNLISLELTKCYLRNKEANYYTLEHLEEFTLSNFGNLQDHVSISWLIRGDEYRSACLAWLSLVLSRSTSSLRKLGLSRSGLRDGEMLASIGELSNLRELDLSGNYFSRLDFSLSQLTRLKHLDLSWCLWLVELPQLPSSLAILEANTCPELKAIGDVHKKCKFLCNVSLSYGTVINDGSRLLEKMLQGNAIQNHNMVLKLKGFEIAKGFKPSFRQGHNDHVPYRLQLPENWCNEFSGFLMCAVFEEYSRIYSINMNQMIRCNCNSNCNCFSPQDDVVWEESDSDKYKTIVWYVSFASLRHTTWWNSVDKTYNGVSSLHFEAWCSIGNTAWFGVRLVPRKSKSGPTQTSTAQEQSDFSHYAPKLTIYNDSDNGLGLQLA